MSQVTDASGVSAQSARLEFYKKLTNVLGIQQKEAVQGADRLSHLKGWDSLSILEVMSMADSVYHVDLDPQQIAQCQTVSDLASLVLTPKPHVE